MSWTFLWLMLFLKIPIVGLLSLVWWAIRQKPEEAPTDGAGGSRHVHRPPPRGHRPPRLPRRGPHGVAAPSPPARMRITRARGRRIAR